MVGGGIGRVGGLEMWKGETRVRRGQMGQKQMGRLLQQAWTKPLISSGLSFPMCEMGTNDGGRLWALPSSPPPTPICRGDSP